MLVLSVKKPNYAGSYVSQRNTENCREILRDTLESLTLFCQNALGMKTAIVSVSLTETKNIDDDQISDESIIYPKRQMSRISPSIIPRNRQVRYNFVDPVSSLSQMNKPFLGKLITSPKHTEVFKIRVKRQEALPKEKMGEIQDISLGRDNDKPSWDVLDVMSHVRFSFFGKLFENGLQQASSGDVPEFQPGQKRIDPGLFETVKITLSNVEYGMEGFLMIVFGGRLSEIDDSHTPLIQSLKHIMENTDPLQTLIVLTGSCTHDDEEVRIQKNETDEVRINEKSKRNVDVIPVFAKGPKIDKLTEITNLYDVPVTIKNILEEISPNFGENSLGIAKRSLFSGIPHRNTRCIGQKIINVKILTFMMSLAICIVI